MPLLPRTGYVRMTHSLIPGAEEYATIAAYRGVWYDLGWRASVDDPSFSKPTAALNGIDHTWVPKGWGKHWRDARQEATSRVVRVHFWGDSITVGDDASSDNSAGAPNNTTAQKDAWRADSFAGVFRDGLQARWGDAGEGYEPFGLAVTTGTWTSFHGFGTFEAQASAAATATWKVKGTTVKIFHRNTTLVGSFRWQIDGGAFTTVTPPTGFGVNPGVVTASGLSDTEHTVVVEWVSGTIGINGVQGLRGSTGILVDRLAQHGLGAMHLTDYAAARRGITIATTNGNDTITAASGSGFTEADIGAKVDAPGVTLGSRIGTVPTATTATLIDASGGAANATATAAAVTALISQPVKTVPAGGIIRPIIAPVTVAPSFSEGVGQADLVVVALGVNDPSASPQSTPESLADGLSQIIRTYANFSGGSDPQYTPDYIFVINHLGKWFDINRQYAAFAAAIRDTAAGVDGAVIDMWAAGRRSWPYAQAQGYWAGATHDNSVHLSKAGHGVIADALLALTV